MNWNRLVKQFELVLCVPAISSPAQSVNWQDVLKGAKLCQSTSEGYNPWWRLPRVPLPTCVSDSFGTVVESWQFYHLLPPPFCTKKYTRHLAGLQNQIPQFAAKMIQRCSGIAVWVHFAIGTRCNALTWCKQTTILIHTLDSSLVDPKENGLYTLSETLKRDCRM